MLKQINNEILFVPQIRREGGDVVQVCQKTFKSVLAIGPKRLCNLLRYLWENKNPRPERRGGFRVKQGYAELKAEIINHIKKFKCYASHYGRNKTPNRKYLPSTLSVRKMYMMFKDEYEGPIDVKYGFYYGIFVSKFNLGFGSPRKDVCSFCTSHKVQIRATTDPQKKKELLTELLVHKFRARKFYQLLDTKQDDSVLTIAFDLMQNVALPKSPIGEAYCARQLWAYFLGIIEHKAVGNKNVPGTQQKEDVHFYTWGEHQMCRGANQIASALCDFIEKRLEEPDHGIKKIILFNDSCVGQNKNYSMLSTINLLSNKHGIPITHIFPVRGHSYMPPDRAFGRVEQRLKKIETVLLPEEYYQEFATVGTVHVYDQDWWAYNFKDVPATHLKTQHSFKITEAKILEVTKSAPVKVYNHYSAAPCEHAILKRGHQWNNMEISPLDNTNCVKPAKKRDVLGLLGDMGYSTTPSADTVRPMTRAQTIAHFYNEICNDAADAMDIGSGDSESEDEATVEVDEDPWN